MDKKYYDAYDERYKTVHNETGSAWAGETPTHLLKDWLKKYGANKNSSILELGCGEGQNALYLQQNGFDVYASDVAPEAIKWCKQKALEYNQDADKYFVLDAVAGKHDKSYDFIYTVSTLHMLVVDSDRKAFLDFVYNHLNKGGKAIITSMGDGEMEKHDSDISRAFDLAQRDFEGTTISVATTTCKIVNWADLLKELENSSLNVLEAFVTDKVSGFNSSMVVVVSK
jgi:cyclopropane fatty-acyl-phospholipid synthase-like methyltransferase